MKATFDVPGAGDGRRSNENPFIIRAAMNNRGKHARDHALAGFPRRTR